MAERHHKITLYEVYQGLLTEKQQKIFEATYYEDLSLAEIAEHTKTSRQAVHDVLRRTEDLLESYERTLGLWALEAAYDEVMGQVAQSLSSDQWPHATYDQLLRKWKGRKDPYGL